MIRIGTVTGRKVGKNRDGTDDVLLLQVEITDPDDIQTVELMQPAGQKDYPIDDSQVVILDIGNAFKAAVAVQDGVTPSGSPGDKELYSLDSAGLIKAFINILASGNIELNGNNDNAVRFQALQDKLTALKAQLEAHFHPGVTVGAGSTSPSATVFDVDISASKVDEVQLP